jgi:ABC-type phosphate transport system ATPase subunit
MWPERETLCKHPKDRYKKERNKMEAYTNDIIMQIRNLDVSYDGKLILHDISMDIRKNRITAIIGPSGCGKTTFLKTLNGLLQEERGAKVSGRISLEGTEIQQVSLETLRKNVGLVFQTPAPFPFSIYKNLTYAPVYYGIRDKKKLAEIVEEKLKLAGLYEEVSGHPHQNIPVIFRIFLGRAQSFVIHHIDLDVLSVMLDIFPDHALNNLQSLFPRHTAGIKAQVHQGSVK